MVMLGMGMLFGVGRYVDSARPVVGRGMKTGTVLVPASNLDLSLVAGLPVVENLPNHLSVSPPSSVDVELPAPPNDTLFGQPDDGMGYDRIVGRIFAWTCTTFYLTSRLPQIWKNVSRTCASCRSL